MTNSRVIRSWSLREVAYATCNMGVSQNMRKLNFCARRLPRPPCHGSLLQRRHRAIADESSDAPAALRLAEGACLAYVRHAAGGASVFVDGECVATLSEAASSHAPMLCGSHRLDAGSLAGALCGSSEVRDLVERLVQRDVLWAEI